MITVCLTSSIGPSSNHPVTHLALSIYSSTRFLSQSSIVTHQTHPPSSSPHPLPHVLIHTLSSLTHLINFPVTLIHFTLHSSTQLFFHQAKPNQLIHIKTSPTYLVPHPSSSPTPPYTGQFTQ